MYIVIYRLKFRVVLYLNSPQISRGWRIAVNSNSYLALIEVQILEKKCEMLYSKIHYSILYTIIFVKKIHL
jgi:hypothetical protein